MVKLESYGQKMTDFAESLGNLKCCYSAIESCTMKWTIAPLMIWMSKCEAGYYWVFFNYVQVKTRFIIMKPILGFDETA